LRIVIDPAGRNEARNRSATRDSIVSPVPESGSTTRRPTVRISGSRRRTRGRGSTPRAAAITAMKANCATPPAT
jgi:hypothetical protein